MLYRLEALWSPGLIERELGFQDCASYCDVSIRTVFKSLPYTVL